MARVLPVGGLVNLYAPWDVPIAIAKASTPVCRTKSAASSGSVSICAWLNMPEAPEPSSSPARPVSNDPSTPNSPSTETPMAWAISTIFLVTSILYR